MNQTSQNLLLHSFICIICLCWSYTLLFIPNPWIFLDGVNLLFHEAGHILLFWAGEFITILGGTIFQLLIPALVLIQFLRTRQYFGASFTIWWLGDNLINVGHYMADARAQVLPTIGHGHDWNWLFVRLGLLQQDQLLGTSTIYLGKVTLLAGLALMIWQLYRQLQNQTIPIVNYSSSK